MGKGVEYPKLIVIVGVGALNLAKIFIKAGIGAIVWVQTDLKTVDYIADYFIQ